MLRIRTSLFDMCPIVVNRDVPRLLYSVAIVLLRSPYLSRQFLRVFLCQVSELRKKYVLHIMFYS